MTEYMQDMLLAALQLQQQTWVPSTMQPLAFDQTSPDIQMISQSSTPVALSQGEALSFIKALHTAKKSMLPDIHSKWIPPELRFAFKELHPWIPEPNRIIEGTVGYSMRVCTFWLAIESHGTCSAGATFLLNNLPMQKTRDWKKTPMRNHGCVKKTS